MKRLAILTVFVAAAVAHIPADAALMIGSRQAALVVKDTRFDPALQLSSELRLGLGRRWHRGTADPSGRHLPGFGLDGGIALGATGASRPVEGAIYRGLVTRSAWLSASWWGSAGIGVAIAGSGVLAAYESTPLLMFHTELEVAAILVVRTSTRTSIRWSLPLVRQFRRDLACSLGAGVRADLRLEFRAP